MTGSTPTADRFTDPEDADAVEEFDPADRPDPTEPESIVGDEASGPADPGEADAVDVAEQDEIVDEDDGYDAYDSDQ